VASTNLFSAPFIPSKVRFGKNFWLFGNSRGLNCAFNEILGSNSPQLAAFLYGSVSALQSVVVRR